MNIYELRSELEDALDEYSSANFGNCLETLKSVASQVEENDRALSDTVGNKIKEAIASVTDSSDYESSLHTMKGLVDEAEIKGFHADIKSVEEDEEDWIIEGYASTAKRDRDGEVIPPDAIDMSDYNGVIKYNHGKDHEIGDNPIGKTIKYRIDEKGLWIRAKISKASRYGKQIWGMIKEGILNSFSIAAPSALIEKVEDQITYWPVAEISVVSVPSNPEGRFAPKDYNGLMNEENQDPTQASKNWAGWDSDATSFDGSSTKIKQLKDAKEKLLKMREKIKQRGED